MATMSNSGQATVGSTSRVSGGSISSSGVGTGRTFVSSVPGPSNTPHMQTTPTYFDSNAAEPSGSCSAGPSSAVGSSADQGIDVDVDLNTDEECKW